MSSESWHAHSAEVMERIAESSRARPLARRETWSTYGWATELEAAGRISAAADALATAVALEQEKLNQNMGSPLAKFYALVALAQMLGRAGEAERRVAVLTEAGRLLATVAAEGEPFPRRGNDYEKGQLAFHLRISGRPDEPPVPDGELEVPLAFGQWSTGDGISPWSASASALYDRLAEIFPVTRDSTGRPALSDTGSDEAARKFADLDVPQLLELTAAHRRLVTRCAGGLLAQSVGPIRMVNRGVEIARRLRAADPVLGTEPLVRCLPDRSQMFTTVQAHAAALEDFTEVQQLVGWPSARARSKPAS
jgi:hypothetical protein